MVNKLPWVFLRQIGQPFKIPPRLHFRFLDDSDPPVLHNDIIRHSKSSSSRGILFVSRIAHCTKQAFSFTHPQTIGQQIRFFKPLPSGFILFFDFILRKPNRPLDRPAPEAVEGGAQ